MRRRIAALVVMLMCMLPLELYGPVVAPRTRAPEVTQAAIKYRIAPELADIIAFQAYRYSIPLPIAFRLIKQESGFNTRAVGMAGERGLTQVLPSTARYLGVNPLELSRPRVGVATGFRYLQMHYRRYHNWHRALVAYNQGPAVADTLFRSPYSERIVGR